jgi:hypothetical protein
MNFNRLTSVLIVGLMVSSAAAQVALEVDVGERIEDIKRIIDFFHLYDNNNDFKNLRPRYIVPYKGDRGDVDGIRSAGCIPVLSLHECDSENDARSIVSGGESKGVQHYVVWTEPNRTWGDWLKNRTWESFLTHTEALYRGARSADPNCLLSGPCITTDPRDNLRWNHLTTFLIHWAERDMRLDYVNVHPPYEPDDIYQASSMAQGFANTQPQMHIKGMTIGEYPFYRDGLAIHVRYFLAFESAWNVLWAAKSNYEENNYNSGLIDRSGRKLPAYWLFYQYARMEGKRVATTKGGTDDHVQVLASYSAANRRLHMLVGNDGGTDETIVLTLKTVTGDATVTTYGFTGGGTDELSQVRRSASNGTLNITPGTVADKDARYITVDFDTEQPSPPQAPPGAGTDTGGHPIPGTIQAEDYDRGGQGVAYHDTDPGNSGGAYRPGEGVDIKTGADDDGGGYIVGWTEAGEWIEYTVDVSETGNYRLEMRVGSAENGGSCHLEVDGVDLTGPIACPNTGSWDSYQSVAEEAIELEAGTQVVRLVFDGSAMDVNYLQFERATSIARTPATGIAAPPRPASTLLAAPVGRRVSVPASARGFELFSLRGRRLWRYEDGLHKHRIVPVPAGIGGMIHIRFLDNKTSADGVDGRYIRD